ncbi:MAG: hypothetical protein JXR41_15530 [Bacteroidales bacterium]|nr:hypothetical protein [Bacteroidales bacterium]MBN2764505.1 hypothetical protein [Bacteroidales bacterium]
MKKQIRISGFIIIIFFICVPGLKAQEGGTGLGIMLGEPTGISFKTWISGSSAIDAGLSWSFPAPGAFHSHIDYLWHNFNIIRMNEGKLPLYLGLGGRARITGNDVILGARVPIGMAYIFAEDRLDVFLELVPVMNLVPGIDFDFGGAVGIRYFFIRKS